MRTFDLADIACPVDVDPLEIGDNAPDFTLVDIEFNEATLARYHGLRKVIVTVPGVDLDGPAQMLGTLAARFAAADLDKVALVVVSRDTPLALRRFVSEPAFAALTALSSYRSERFGEDYGAEITDGRAQGLYATTLSVLDENDTIAQYQFVASDTTQPDFDALAATLGFDWHDKQ